MAKEKSLPTYCRSSSHLSLLGVGSSVGGIIRLRLLRGAIGLLDILCTGASLVLVVAAASSPLKVPVEAGMAVPEASEPEPTRRFAEVGVTEEGRAEDPVPPATCRAASVAKLRDTFLPTGSQNSLRKVLPRLSAPFWMARYAGRLSRQSSRSFIAADLTSLCSGCAQLLII